MVKQADLVLALFLRGDRFTDDEKARDFAYYEAITVRDSSLSACMQAVVAAEVGHVELAYDYFGEAALMDLDDLMDNTRDGLHIASLAGSWIAAVAGFGGMRDHARRAVVPPAAARRADPARVPRHVPRPLPAGRGPARRGDLRGAERRPARDRARRRARPRSIPKATRSWTLPGGRRGADAAAGPRAAAARARARS